MRTLCTEATLESTALAAEAFILADFKEVIAELEDEEDQEDEEDKLASGAPGACLKTLKY
jgi:hypothetical protein